MLKKGRPVGVETQFVDSPINKEETEVTPDVPDTGQKEDFYEKWWKYITVTAHKYGESAFMWNTKFPKAHLICQEGHMPGRTYAKTFLKSEPSHIKIAPFLYHPFISGSTQSYEQ